MLGLIPLGNAGSLLQIRSFRYQVIPGVFLEMPTVIHVEGSVSWRAFRDPSSGRWVAICDAIGLATDADTWVQLQERTQRHLSCLFDGLLRDHKLEAFFRSKGWHVRDGMPEHSSQDVHYDIPIELLIERDARSAREA